MSPYGGEGSNPSFGITLTSIAISKIPPGQEKGQEKNNFGDDADGLIRDQGGSL